MTRLFALSSLLLASIPAFAQDAVRETVVVTAAATPVQLGSVTRPLTVITREQIALLPVHTVADVLRLVASVDVRARGERGAQTDFAVRGANFGQVLMLVDGVRLNDAQSAHHNGDVPVPLEAVERIEVLHGPGSALFGADAFGGAINVITRRDAVPASLTVEAGSFGLAAVRGQAGGAHGAFRHVFAGLASHADGFMFERGYTTAGFSSRTSIGDRSGVFVSYLSKDFGANRFYGDAPSHEWTNQTLIAADHRFAPHGGWTMGAATSYRTHGDHFIFDVTHPAVSDNRHRTHAAIGSFRASRTFKANTSVTAGLEMGGDRIHSGTLGDHDTARISGFGEWRQAVSPRGQLDASLRVDRYSEFGASWSPALGAGWWLTQSVRLRSSVARAFRVPTFTERYYQDPAHWARPDLRAETAWAGDAGADLFLRGGLFASATLFGRLEAQVIDWLRPTTADRWRTYNVRAVDTLGIELSVRKMLGAGAFVQAGYTGLDVRAPAVTQLSKYVRDYAPHTITAAAAMALPGAVRFAPRIEYKHRTRAIGTADSTLFDAKVGRRFRAVEVFVEGTNLFNQAYQEVALVPMPGRAVSLSLTLSAR